MILGITGGIGTGKSSVLKILKESGVDCVSADSIAHKITQKGDAAYFEIIQEFGNSILDENQNIDRSALGRIVFDDDAARKKLESILHPKIIAIIDSMIQAFKKSEFSKNIFAVEVPLLYECGMQDSFDKVLVVNTEPEFQLSRLKSQGIPESEAKNRISAQMPLEKKCEMADFVIENNGSLPLLKEKVKKIIENFAEVG